MAESLGVAVIGAGMAGKAHAAAYRTASALYSPVLPGIRLVSIGDVNAEFGSLAARRFGYERNDTSWQAIAEADDIDVVSVVIANSLHREVVEGLLAAGKHVLCEKPLSDHWKTPAPWPTLPATVQPSPGSASPSAGPPASPTSATSSRTAPSATSCTSAAATGPTTASAPPRR